MASPREIRIGLCLTGLTMLLCSLSIVSAKKKCHPLKDLDYEFFGTKTIYSDARNYLSKTDDDDLPKPFDDDSLQEEHDELVKNRCTPIVLYFIGRHSARFPDSEDIDQYNKDLSRLIDKLKSSNTCPDKLQELLNWQTKMQPKYDNLITELGAREERDIARRLKSIYPEFFDTQTSDIALGVTNKIRTAQTGAQFLAEVAGLSLPNCANQTLPTNDVYHPDYNLDKVVEATCYKDMMAKYSNPILDFHKQCEKIRGEEKITDPLIDRVKSPEIKRRIANRVASKLGLDNSDEPPVRTDVLDSIYNMCKFENALKNDSVWCDLFDKQDIEALEYIEDVKSYIASAYGPKANPKQSCPLVKHLLEAMQMGSAMKDDEKGKSYFYFSHADPMKKLFAAFGLFRDDNSFTESQIRNFERQLRVPKRRNWRSSIIIPFSGNMELVLYRCQKPDRPVKFKVLSAVNEQPVKLAGCDDDTVCSFTKLFNTYESFRDCDLDKICART